MAGGSKFPAVTILIRKVLGSSVKPWHLTRLEELKHERPNECTLDGVFLILEQPTVLRAYYRILIPQATSLQVRHQNFQIQEP